MKEYHKIQTIYKRNAAAKFRNVLEGVFSIPEFAYLQNNAWLFTEKINGMSIRIKWQPNDLLPITFGGKANNAQIPALLCEVLVKLVNYDKFAKIFGDNTDVCLYGEGYGAKIQKGGGNYRQDQSFVLFDIKIGTWFLSRDHIEGIAKQLKIDIVPVIGEGTLLEAVEKTKKGFNSQWGDFLAEGIVARPVIELRTRSGERLITKIKYKDFAHE